MSHSRPVGRAALRAALLALAVGALPAAAPPSSPTSSPPPLAQALHDWTGLTVDVLGAGPRVTIVLPPQSVVPSFTARAGITAEHGEPGWLLSDLALPQPLVLRGGGARILLRGQSGQAWLGTRAAHAQAEASGISVQDHGHATRIGSARMSVRNDGALVAVSLDLAGIVPDPSAADTLLPSHLALRGHTTSQGAVALNAMAAGRAAPPAPVSIDALDAEIGPSHITASGTVFVRGPHDRRGSLSVSATHFGDLMRAIPTDGPAVRLYPALMVLRQMGQKQGDAMVWTLTFDGARVMLDGIDLAPLLGW